MPDSIKAMWDEFAAGLGPIPKYELSIMEQVFVAGAYSMFGAFLTGAMTPKAAREIMREINQEMTHA